MISVIARHRVRGRLLLTALTSHSHYIWSIVGGTADVLPWE